MDNGNTTFIKPEVFKMPPFIEHRLDDVNRAVANLDAVTPDYDISIEPKINIHAPVSTGEYGGYGNAVLSAANNSIQSQQNLTPVVHDAALRQQQLDERNRIVLTKNTDPIDTALWDSSILTTPESQAELPFAPFEPFETNIQSVPQAPLAVPHHEVGVPFNPLNNWGVAHSVPATSSQNQAFQQAPRLEFPRQTGPDAITHQLPINYVEQTTANVTEPVVIAPAVPQSPEVSAYEERLRLARERTKKAPTTEELQAKIKEQLIGI